MTQTFLSVLVLVSAAYHSLSLIASLRRLRKRRSESSFTPPISILKPVHGRDPEFYESIATHAAQGYPDFEILFGASDPADAALDDVRRLQRAYPSIPIQIVISQNRAANGKAAVLAALAAQARHAILLVNDSDIRVGPGYLRDVVAPLANSRTGVVTCLYRARGSSFPARFEALGVATEFAASVLVARLIGVVEFAMGSTMVLRRAQLERIGGFEAVYDFLADDYQLGHRIAQLGYRVEIPDQVVETNLGAGSWRDVWNHQVRWSRTVRVSRPAGYYGYAVTQLTFWCLLAALAGLWRTALAGLALRLLAGVVTSAAVLQDRQSPRLFWLMPVRDLWGVGVWIAGLGGKTVEWRGERLRLSRDGRIRAMEPRLERREF